jgi:rod shape-determining protein MreC
MALSDESRPLPMARLNDRLNLTRRGTRLGERGRLTVLLPMLMLASAGLLLLSRVNHSALTRVRTQAAEMMSPLLRAIMVPLEPLRHAGRQIANQASMADEMQRLQLENQKLNSWEWRARDLERKLSDLEALSKVAEEPHIPFVTARVIADASGPFARSIMISAGKEQNVKSGYPVINGDGLAGHVLETGQAASRVLLLTDVNSRVPVEIGAARVRAILAGDNGPSPKLIFVPAGAHIAPGDEVATSGTGGVFPRGLRIGVLSSDIAAPRVSLRARLDNLEYISILRYDNPALKLMAEPLQRPQKSRTHAQSPTGSKMERQ